MSDKGPPCNHYLKLNANTESKQCHAWDVEEHNILCLELKMVKMNWKCINVITYWLWLNIEFIFNSRD